MTKIKMFFAIIGLHIMNFFHRFLYTHKEYTMVETKADCFEKRYNDLLTSSQKKIQCLERQLSEEMLLKSELQGQVAMVIQKNSELKDYNDSLKRKLDQLEEYKRVDAEYLRETQKQLSEEFGMHPVFGFPRSPGLPGSTSITTVRTRKPGESDEFTVSRGRIILDDQLTMQINQTPHMYEKMQLVLGFMARYGSLERLMKDIIYNGGMSMTLAYRDDTTTYEVYFETTAKNYNADSIMVFNMDTGCAENKGEEKNGEG